MKKISKIVLLVLAAVLLLGVLCACSGAASYAGSWYNATNPDDDSVIILTKDKAFSWDGYGGEYSVEDGKLILIDNFWGSEALDVSKIDGITVLTDEDGDIWIKGQSKAQSYYEKEAKKKVQAAEKSSDLAGEYVYCIYYSGEETENDGLYLKLNADKTYEYKYEDVYSTIMGTDRADCWQTGTWSIGFSGSLNSEGVKIVFTPNESGGYNDIGSDAWIDENTPPSSLEDVTYYYLSEDKQDNLYIEFTSYWKKD